MSEANFLERMERCRKKKKKKLAPSMSSDALLCRCVDLSVLHLSVSIKLRRNPVPRWRLRPTPRSCGAASGRNEADPCCKESARPSEGSSLAVCSAHPSAPLELATPRAGLCRLTHVGQLAPLAPARMLRKRDGCGQKDGLE